MKMKAKELKYDKPHIKDGLYHANLKEVKSIEDGQYGSRVALVFDVYYAIEKAPVELAIIAYEQITPKSKLTKTLEPLGYKYEEKKTFDTDEFLGNPCRVLVETYETKEGDEASGIGKVMAPDGQTVEYISKIKDIVKSSTEEIDNTDPMDLETVHVEDIEEVPSNV